MINNTLQVILIQKKWCHSTCDKPCFVWRALESENSAALPADLIYKLVAHPAVVYLNPVPAHKQHSVHILQAPEAPKDR